MLNAVFTSDALYVAQAVGMFSTTIYPSLRSNVTRIVDKFEVGKALGTLALVQVNQSSRKNNFTFSPVLEILGNCWNI